MKKVTKKSASDKERKDSESSDEVQAYQCPKDCEEQANEDILRPGGEKVGEGPGKLRRRERWFQQRTGSSRK